MNGESTIVISGYPAKEAVTLHRALSKHYSINMVDDSEEVLHLLSTQEIDLLLCKHTIDHFDAIDLLHKARMSHPEVVRLLAGHLNTEEIKKAIKEAAIYQFVPIDSSSIQVELLVSRALENRELSYRHRHLSRDFKIAEDVLRKRQLEDEPENGHSQFEKLIYCSHNMADLCNLAKKASTTNLPILIQGETGTGKELMARGIHYNSNRSEQPLLVHNCGGMSDELLHSELFGHKRGAFTGAISDRMGLLPAADGGTVFLDEIGDISPTFQVSLLRFLQEGEVKPLGSDRIIKCDVRVIAACNQPIDALISKGEFRQDLYYRLNGFQLNIPPLRKRIEDVDVLTNYLAKKYAHETNRTILGISPGVKEKFLLHAWPGNVRELENEIKRMVALTDNGTFITEETLSPHLQDLKPIVKSMCVDCNIDDDGYTLKEKVEKMESKIITEALERLRWNQSKAAKELGLSRVGLSNKIKRYGLDTQIAVA